MDERIINVNIDKCDLDVERGFVSFAMYFMWQSAGQGLGGYCIYNPNFPEKDLTGKLLMNLCKVFDVMKFKDIKGVCRIEKEDDSWGAKIIKIGHIVEDRWLNLSTFDIETKE